MEGKRLQRAHLMRTKSPILGVRVFRIAGLAFSTVLFFCLRFQLPAYFNNHALHAGSLSRVFTYLVPDGKWHEFLT